MKIAPSRGWRALDLGEIWRYRELALFLTRRDISVRYKQTILGATWVLLQPVLMMAIFSIFFGGLARVPSDGLPYPLFVFAGLIPWQLFAYSLGESSNSIVGNQRLISKVYFPRLVIPIAATLPALLDLGVSSSVLVALLLWYRVVPGVAILVLPFFVVLALGAALGVGVWLSALNVQFRDVRYTIPFLSQIWLFATPIVYPSSLVPEPWRAVYGLNPMAGVVEGFRWALLGAPPPPPGLLAASALGTVALLVGGAIYFRRMERSFADVL